MTKDAYFEMCEALGSEPIEEEIPLEIDDLPTEAQTAILLFNGLKDIWDHMNGTYLGKQRETISQHFDLMGVPEEDRRILYELICDIDNIRVKMVMDKKPKKK